MPQPRSSSLFHFTKSLDRLQGILKNHFLPHFSLEDLTWLHPDVGAWAFPMVCFCDIPLSRIDEHVKFYGRYGIGLKREWAVKSKLNPVFYVSRDTTIGSNFHHTLKAVIAADQKAKERADQEKKEHNKEIWLRGLQVLGYMKPLNGSVQVGEKTYEKDFYLENEWRYCPLPVKGQQPVISRKFFEDKDRRKQQEDEIQAAEPLSFTSDDVRYIFVPTDADIPPLVDFMDGLSHIPHEQIKILQTRITSLESIAKDV
jgi:hypothetical protein